MDDNRGAGRRASGCMSDRTLHGTSDGRLAARRRHQPPGTGSTCEAVDPAPTRGAPFRLAPPPFADDASHGQAPLRPHLDHRRARGRLRARHGGPSTRRTDQRGLAPRRRLLHLRGRLPLLQQDHRRQDLRPRSATGDPRGPPQRRPRLRTHQPVDRLRSPFRGDRGTGTPGWPDARGPVRLSPRRPLDHHRRRPRRRGAGLRHSLLVASARRQDARTDGQGGDRHRGGLHGARGRHWHHDHPDRRAGAGGGQRPQGESVGHRHARAHDPDRPLHGPLPSLHPASPRARSERDGDRDARRGTLRRTMGRGESGARTAVHLRWSEHRAHGDRLWLCCGGAPRLAAPRPARLPQRLRQDRRRPRARGRHTRGAASAGDAGRHALRRWHGPGVRGQALPVRLHHDRVRVDLRLPRPDLVRHDAEAARERGRCPDGRLRRHAHGIGRRDHGPHRRLCSHARHLFRHQCPGRTPRHHPGVRGRGDPRLGVRD